MNFEQELFCIVYLLLILLYFSDSVHRGYADQLGSGVRNLFKYSRLYSGEDPEFIEGDIFKIIVPLNEKYSFDYQKSVTTGKTGNASEKTGNALEETGNAAEKNRQEDSRCIMRSLQI